MHESLRIDVLWAIFTVSPAIAAAFNSRREKCDRSVDAPRSTNAENGALDTSRRARAQRLFVRRRSVAHWRSRTRIIRSRGTELTPGFGQRREYVPHAFDLALADEQIANLTGRRDSLLACSPRSSIQAVRLYSFPYKEDTHPHALHCQYSCDHSVNRLGRHRCGARRLRTIGCRGWQCGECDDASGRASSRRGRQLRDWRHSYWRSPR